MAVHTPELSPHELNELLSGLIPDIPGYRVLRLIGRGGMSYVYLGVQQSLDRQVAIKVIAPDALNDEVSKMRFEKEARTIAKLQHPCIVGIYEVSRTEEGLLYYVLPYLSKGHLGERDLRGNEAAIIDVLRSLLWALDYAHVRGVVHRDVKAENVLFDNADRPLLTDFGIAVNRREHSRMTGDGFVIGSGTHMAPEQARGDKVDGRADLYSMGVLTYEMLCGELPFQNPDGLGMALMHATDPIPRLPPGLQHWQTFIDRAMAKSPSARFADAQEMMKALDRVAARTRFAGIGLRALSVLGRMGGNVRGLLVTGAAIVTLLLVAILFWPSGASDDAEPGRQPDSPVASASLPATPTPPPVPEEALANAPPEPGATGDTELVDTSAEEGAVEAVRLPPGVHELAAATRQISRRRLTQPAGDNAFDSLRAAKQILPDSPRLVTLGERWLSAATPYVDNALKEGDRDAAVALFGSGATLADELQLRQSAAWNGMQQLFVQPLRQRIQSALQGNDLSALRAARSEATALGLTPDVFGPLWSQSVVTAKPGDPIHDGNTRLVLVRPPAAAGPGIAIMPTAVSRADYAVFASASGRDAASCRIRTASVTFRKRSWEKPGFAQAGDHPAVCVSVADALAYADWLGSRNGQRYRLPDRREWQSLTAAPMAATACASSQTLCQGKGTSSSTGGPTSALGVHSNIGNVREWSADCGGSCSQRLSVGFSWRDSPDKTDGRSADSIDVEHGYDDVGFRLLREVGREELAQR